MQATEFADLPVALACVEIRPRRSIGPDRTHQSPCSSIRRSANFNSWSSR